METPGSGAHVLVFPYPAQGHMIPLLDLTHHLATRGLSITILVTPKNLPLLSPLLSRHPPSSVRPLVLNFPNYPSIPPGVENNKDLPNYGFPLMVHALGFLRAPLLEWWSNHPSPPVAILSDMFLGWTHSVAEHLGVPRVVFSPSAALALSVICSLWTDLPKNPENDDALVVSFPKIPNSPSYPWWQISPLYRSYVEGDPVSESIKECFLGDVASWGLVVNSLDELECVYLNYLKEELGHDRVWAVGPLLTPTERGGSSSQLASDVLSWLDTCEDHSVVYVCFGSQAVLTNEQMDELAFALEKSGARFLWCVKDPTEGHVAGHYGVVPPGFEDRTAGRGLVVRGWVPQVAILEHRSVVVFLTHCGWNSILESIFAGVPMLAWPMTADQFIDATLLVEELEVAIRVCEGVGAVPDSNELARLFTRAVREGRAETDRALELRTAALEAIEKGGSSYNNLDEFVRNLSTQDKNVSDKCNYG